ncbi:hypothetical protein LXL04_019899 [Taraxacum kok-saghyz]
MVFSAGQAVEVADGEAFVPGRILAVYPTGALIEYDNSVGVNGFPKIELVLYCVIRPSPPPGLLKVQPGYMVEFNCIGRWWKGQKLPIYI